MTEQTNVDRLADLRRQLKSVKRQIVEAEYGDDYCYSTGKMRGLEQKKNLIDYTISAIEAEEKKS